MKIGGGWHKAIRVVRSGAKCPAPVSKTCLIGPVTHPNGRASHARECHQRLTADRGSPSARAVSRTVHMAGSAATDGDRAMRRTLCGKGDSVKTISDRGAAGAHPDTLAGHER
ncbi:hypothetical protein Ais01nite_49450 [Asanoa ishikariensis]|nr:hypothetical protein Ais01nite_49450 [Asanoa ishikariensis]